MTFREGAPLKVRRFDVPHYPFWPSTLIYPYGRGSSIGIGLDYQSLTASGPFRGDVAVCTDVYDRLSREELVQPLRPPVLIDTSSSAESIYRQSAGAASYCNENGLAAMTLLSADGAIPEGVSRLVLTTWPTDFDRLTSLATAARRQSSHWGMLVPLIFPLTTASADLVRLADLAASNGAIFFTAVAFEVEPSARQLIASSEQTPLDDKTYSLLFHGDLDSINLETESAIAALAHERGLSDFVVPPDWSETTNWNGAVLLTLAATRLIRMKQDVELGWKLIRSAQQLALLDKPIGRVAQAVGLGGLPGVDPQSRQILESWLAGGESEFLTSLQSRWRGL
ncbi:MAG TPA: hypothetical protein VNM92_08170, partial [Thermoanaerobaculia bacterium]|nr:hypothetical protein [Thermoanaerobaculia bacterium]